jgi:hypothetical protein
MNFDFRLGCTKHGWELRTLTNVKRRLIDISRNGVKNCPTQMRKIKNHCVAYDSQLEASLENDEKKERSAPLVMHVSEYGSRFSVL